MKLVGNNMRCGKTLQIIQEYEKQKAEGKTCKLVTKEDMKKKKQGDITWMYGYHKQKAENKRSINYEME